MKRITILLIASLFLFSCAHAVSKELREKADKNITDRDVFVNTDRYKGRIVILGGNIISSRNTNEGTYLEVLQKPLDYRGHPKGTDSSHGRFMIFHEGFIDSAIYSKGKEITVAGEILGTIVRPLGEIDYSYPLIQARELHLFELRPGGLPVHFSIGVGAFF